MFNNVGAKCKTLAKVLCWIGIIGSIGYGLFLLFVLTGGNSSAIIGISLLIMIGGSLASWLASLSLYAIGEAAENSEIAANHAIKADMERNGETESEEEIDEYDLFDNE